MARMYDCQRTMIFTNLHAILNMKLEAPVLNMICSVVVLMLLILALIAAYTLKPDRGRGTGAVVVTDLSGRPITIILDRIA